MRHIDMKTWPRREHFQLYTAYDQPHLSTCANVDLTSFYSVVNEREISFNLATVYAITRAANAILDFRYRIRGGEMVEHEIVHPSMTIMSDGGLFAFCALDYVEDFPEFAARAARTIASVRENPTLEDEPGRDDVSYMTAIPLVSFITSENPMPSSPADSGPQLASAKI